VAEQIIRHGSVPRATLGVIITQLPRGDPATPAGASDGPGGTLRVDQVMQGSAADVAGIRSGDFLLTLAGEPAGDIPSLAAAIAARSGATEVRLLRGGKVVTVTVDLQPK
jgi:S1-C subfamily serine protease